MTVTDISDDLTQCDGCGRCIGPTEEYYPGTEDSLLCVDCAPTWKEEWRVRMERVSEAVADGDDDEATRWRLAAEEIAAKIAAGLDPDAKAVWHVDQPDVVLQ
mgnify:CR=1 FL=1